MTVNRKKALAFVIGFIQCQSIVGQTLNVEGNLSVKTNFTAHGDSNLGGRLNVFGLTTINGLNANGNLAVRGSSTFGGTVNVTGRTSVGNLNAGGNLTVDGASILDGTLSVTGETSVDNLDTGGNLTVDGSSTLTGNATFSGNVSVPGVPEVPWSGTGYVLVKRDGKKTIGTYNSSASNEFRQHKGNFSAILKMDLMEIGPKGQDWYSLGYKPAEAKAAGLSGIMHRDERGEPIEVIHLALPFYIIEVMKTMRADRVKLEKDLKELQAKVRKQERKLEELAAQAQSLQRNKNTSRRQID